MEEHEFERSPTPSAPRATPLSRWGGAANAHSLRRSVRTFSDQAVSARDLGRLLSVLAADRGTHSWKYSYPSAGDKYRVRTYLVAKPRSVLELSGGVHRYDPLAHELEQVSSFEFSPLEFSPRNRAIFSAASFVLVLVGDPVQLGAEYARQASRFLSIEAGAMCQALMNAAGVLDFGLCPIGDLAFERVQRELALSESSELLLALCGGYPALQSAGASAPEQRRAPEPDQAPDAALERQEGVSSSLSDYLKSELPRHMVPSRVTVVPRLPLTPTGKVDRAALSRGEHGSPQSSLAAPLKPANTPTRDAQAVLAAVNAVLDKGTASERDSLADLGVDSLQVVRVQTRILKELGIELGVVELLQSPNIAQIVSLIEARRSSTRAPVSDVARQATPRPAEPMRARGILEAINPYLELTPDAIESSIGKGQVDPVDSAAVAYLDDRLLERTGLSARELREEVLGGKVFVSSLYSTPLGRIGVITLPIFASEILENREQVVEQLVRASELAKTVGARVLSLTGLLSSLCEYGKGLVGRTPAGLAVTTGHATTASAVVRNTRNLLELAGRALERETVGVLGLGSIGTTALRLLLASSPHPRGLVLCDVFRKSQELTELASSLRSELGFAGTIEIVTSDPHPGSEFYRARTIVGATNVAGVLSVPMLQPGTVIADDSYPHCFDTRAAISRLQTRRDLLFTEAGLLRAPAAVLELKFVPSVLRARVTDQDIEQLFERDEREITGCVLSGALSVRHPDAVPTVGYASVAAGLSHHRRLDTLRFEPIRLRVDDFVLSTSDVSAFRAQDEAQ